MPVVYPFSKIDVLFKDEKFRTGCLVDSNLLIAFTTLEPHPFYEDAKFLFEKVTEYQTPLFVTHTVKTEYLDLVRRRVLSEALMDTLADPNFKLSRAVQMELKRQRTWIDDQLKKNELAILPDQRLKSVKQTFEPKNHSGQLGWIAFCQYHLAGKLLTHWDKVASRLPLNYAILRGEGSETFLEKDLVWEEMYGVSEKTGLSSNDSMILNAFHSSKLRVIASTDYDLGYACAAEADENRICFVPDRLYARHLKGLKFSR